MASPDHGNLIGARFDLHDLRLRLGLACSAGEMAELAERFGAGADSSLPAGTLGATPSVDAAARQLLRALEQRGQLGELVAHLRQTKPLVEWPEPLVEPQAEPAVAPDPSPFRPDPAAVASPPAPAIAAPPSPLEPIRLDPTALEADVPSAAAAGRDAERRRMLRFGVVGGAALLLVVIAVTVGFAVGRSGSPSSASGTGSPAAGAQLEGGPSLARGAADDLAASVAQIAKACGLSDSTGPARDVLAQAFRRCDRSSLPTLPAQRPSLPEPPDPSPNAAGDRAGAGPRPAPPAAPQGGGCMKRCQTEHQQCRSNECGAEPTQASQYDEYQRCLTRCMSRAAQCKMRCG